MDSVIDLSTTPAKAEKLVVQLGIKHGRAVDLVRSSGDELTIGRAYDNDLVLADEYVAANQVRFFISSDDQQWYLEVLDDSNGVLLGQRSVSRSDGPQAVVSSVSLTLGRTRLKLFSEKHPVAEPRKLASRGWHHGVVGIWLPVVALLAFLVLDILVTQAMHPSNDDISGIGTHALANLLAMLVWVGIWALVSKVFRNQGNYLPQLLAVSVISIVAIPLLILPDWMEFNTNSNQVGKVFTYGVILLIGVVVVRYHLLLATNLLRTWMIAGVLGALILAGTVFVDWSTGHSDFVRRPVYPESVAPESFYLGEVISLDQYMLRLEQDWDRVEDDKLNAKVSAE